MEKEGASSASENIQNALAVMEPKGMANEAGNMGAVSVHGESNMDVRDPEDESERKTLDGPQSSDLTRPVEMVEKQQTRNLRRPDMDDTWAWFPDHRGSFSVRSAYKLSIKAASVDSGEQGTCDWQLFKWQAIWDAPCPLKIQQFLWITAHNSLPVRRNLVKKGVRVDTICPVCHRFDEDGAHMLLKCKPVKKLWRELQLEEQRSAWAQFEDPRHLVESILQLQGTKLLTAISLCWNWWCTRNKVNAEKKSFTHDQIMLQIRRSALEFQDFFSKQEKKKAVEAGTWKRPCTDMIKINIDGSFFKELGTEAWVWWPVMLMEMSASLLRAS
ncbi:hypothetical protein D1007_08811 [Hordeum vulgare]|nr:hypothetical protein D1007_08811 [Hordeum vulgare]